MICVLFIFSLLKLLLYGAVFSVGFEKGQSSHFIEFLGDMINAAFAFLFCTVYYKDCDQNMKNLFIKKSFTLNNNNDNDNENNIDNHNKENNICIKDKKCIN